ncbi:HAMP domain-containing histidine kinase [Candidatus Saccharibacteria bacterium]|nr:HAMP domain-containing histidine kinase [Candidatus Saccharibacteria bacterium]
MEKEVENILLVAHELKAPLAVLRQLALSFEFENSSNEHIRSEMVSVSERAIRQVNDLSKIARLEDGLFEMEPVSVRAICDDVTRELNHLFRYNQRDLRVRYHNHARLVTANRELLHSVIYNFLINAMHYSGKDTRSELTINERAGKIRVNIRDFGPALPMDVWREMRRGWVEKPTSIAMRPGSSGLGLYIASKFSRYMNANVGAIRHRDGTSFFIDLPVSRQARLF